MRDPLVAAATGPLDIERIPRGAICVGSQGAWYRPHHALIFDRAYGKGRVEAFHSTAGNTGIYVNANSEIDAEYFTRSGVQAFEIADDNIRERMLYEASHANIEFKVTKATWRKVDPHKHDIGEVAERVAKYFYKNHSSGADNSKMFCSQFTVQCLQNAMVSDYLG